MILKDKVAVITGAARGIGREIALLMAQLGARVVVNDYGGSEAGQGPAQAPADGVVDEIRRAGGQAVANYDSVATMTGGAHIVQTAIDTFGRVDVVVNNAGILRDRMIFNMTEDEWDAVVNTHLKGTFAVTRAAAPRMKEQRSGRFINMTSTSGLVGNVGQANYAAAKLGIVGLTKVVALDMARYNVTANCISPFAWTRMIGTIPTETDAQKARVEKIKKMSPAHIAPMAAFLASDAAKDITGQVFGVRGKEIMLFGHMRPIMRVHHADGWTVDRLIDMFPGTLQHHLVPLDTSGQYFNYDPLV
jgi:NAD(P)-dependent dehydrogenase (short-subunit alcohol dehydrogenase family)